MKKFERGLAGWVYVEWKFQRRGALRENCTNRQRYWGPDYIYSETLYTRMDEVVLGRRRPLWNYSKSINSRSAAAKLSREIMNFHARLCFMLYSFRDCHIISIQFARKRHGALKIFNFRNLYYAVNVFGGVRARANCWIFFRIVPKRQRSLKYCEIEILVSEYWSPNYLEKLKSSGHK